MMTFTLPICQLCNKEVDSTTTTVKEIFTGQGRKEVLFSVTLGCGCVVDYPEFEYDYENYTQSMKDRFTGQIILTYDDDESVSDEDDE